MPAPPALYNARHPDLGSNLGRIYDEYLTRRGRWFIFLRRDTHFQCSCFDPATQSAADDSCSKCFGTGYKTVAQRMNAFISSPENISSLVTQINVGEWGRLDQYPALLYLPRGYYAQELDLIIEAEWDVPNQAVGLYGNPTTIIRAWKISTIIPILFSDSAQTEYSLTGLEQHNLKPEVLQREFVQERLPILPPQREGLLPGQARAEAYTPDGGNTGTRSPQRESPSGLPAAYRGLGRTSRKTLPGL